MSVELRGWRCGLLTIPESLKVLRTFRIRSCHGSQVPTYLAEGAWKHLPSTTLDVICTFLTPSFSTLERDFTSLGTSGRVLHELSSIPLESRYSATVFEASVWATGCGLQFPARQLRPLCLCDCFFHKFESSENFGVPLTTDIIDSCAKLRAGEL